MNTALHITTVFAMGSAGIFFLAGAWALVREIFS
jgi:hypothetical protein